MTENNDETAGLMYYLPPEMLQNIFIYLPAKDLTRCRAVSPIWREIIDYICTNKLIWRKGCKEDFPNIYMVARKKSKPTLRWNQLYRSLTLWKQLRHASEGQNEFAFATRSFNEIRNFEILRDGVLGVFKKASIVYYNMETLAAVSQLTPITGGYSKYAEDDDVIVILNYNLDVFIIRKLLLRSATEDSIVTFDNVKLFILAGPELFFINVHDEIFVCNLRCRKLTADYLTKTDDGIKSIGFSEGNLNILTSQRNIYSVVNEALVLRCALGPGSNLLHQLHHYNLLEQLDWRIYYQWMSLLKCSIPDGPLRDIVTIKPYGDVFFVGTNWGVLRIYYAPYTDGEIDIFTRDPVKQYNFMEQSDYPFLCVCPILKVDVMETYDGHTVIVAMPKKIVVLNFIHTFETESPMLKEVRRRPREISSQ